MKTPLPTAFAITGTEDAFLRGATRLKRKCVRFSFAALYRARPTGSSPEAHAVERLACSCGLAPSARSLKGTSSALPRSLLCPYYTRTGRFWQGGWENGREKNGVNRAKYATGTLKHQSVWLMIVRGAATLHISIKSRSA